MPQLLVNSNASGASSPGQWCGGAGVLEVLATSFGGGTVTLQARNQDGTFTDVTGTALTANGKILFALPPCQVRVNSTAAPTGLSVAAWRNRKGRLSAILGGSVAPSTVNFTASQMSPGLFGPIDSTTTGGQAIVGLGAGWAGVITGTAATIVAQRTAGAATGMLMVSIDGGAVFQPTYSGANSIFPLFSGLSDTAHTVVVFTNGAYGTNVHYPTSGNVIAVTGTAPALSVGLARTEPFDAGGLAYGTGNPTSIAANYVPNLFPASKTTTQTVGAGSSVPSIMLRTAATELRIISGSQYVFVSINGARPTRYNLGTTNSASPNYYPSLLRITGLSGVAANYNIWNSWGQGPAGQGYLSVESDSALINIATKRRLHQFGDSITQGAGSTSNGDVDTMYAAAALGLTGSTFGVSGNTTNQLAQRFGWDVPGTTRTGTGCLANLVVTSNDVAILAIGRNTAVNATHMTAQNTTDYTNCVNALVTKGYGKILCRGVQVEDATPTVYQTYNSDIAAIVSGLANPNVVYINTDSWTSVARVDGTHPSDAGYIFEVETYEIAAYGAVI